MINFETFFIASLLTATLLIILIVIKEAIVVEQLRVSLVAIAIFETKWKRFLKFSLLEAFTDKLGLATIGYLGASILALIGIAFQTSPKVILIIIWWGLYGVLLFSTVRLLGAFGTFFRQIREQGELPFL